MSSPALQPRTRVTRLAQEAVDKARLTVVPRVRTRAPRVPFVTLVSLVLVGGIVGLLLFNTSMQQASFAASSLQTEADTLAAREQTLRMELDELRNPQRVAQEAQGMGMVIPAAPVFLDLRTGKTSGVRTPVDAGERHPAPAAGPAKPAILAPPPTVVEVPAADDDRHHDRPPRDAQAEASTSRTRTGTASNKQVRKNRNR